MNASKTDSFHDILQHQTPFICNWCFHWTNPASCTYLYLAVVEDLLFSHCKWTTCELQMNGIALEIHDNHSWDYNANESDEVIYKPSSSEEHFFGAPFGWYLNCTLRFMPEKWPYLSNRQKQITQRTAASAPAAHNKTSQCNRKFN